MSDSKQKSGFLKKLLVVYVVIDIIWAALVATFGATILSQIGTMGGAGEGATQVATGLGWVITFIVALFQGAIFLGVFTGFAFVIMLLIALLSNKGGNAS
ncbi:MAG: hypothetical protein AB7W16_25390 [Candidatus Obscuribacterales bacterium]